MRITEGTGGYMCGRHIPPPLSLSPPSLMSTSRPLVTGTYDSPESADRAYSDFRERGYSDEDIHVMMSEDARKRYYDRDADAVKIDEGSKAMEGAGAGAAVGGTLGGVVGAIAGIGGAVLVPGIGVIAGPLAGALAGAGAGGAGGSLVGALIGAGIPEDHAEMYKRDIESGNIVMGVHPRDDDRDYVRDRYREYGARNVYSSYDTETV